MTKKYIVPGLVLIFLLGGQSLGLCLSDRQNKNRDKHDCCEDTSSPISKDAEECLWHCASKKLVSINVEKFSIKGSNINTPRFIQPDESGISRHFLAYPRHNADSYLVQIIPHLSTNQIYFEAVFSRAPPVIR